MSLIKKNKVVIFLIGWITTLSLGLVSCNLQQAQTVTLTVSAAAVYRDVLPEIDKLFQQEKPNIKITYNFAGSGFLRKQIEQGVPADIYIPGVAKEMNILQAKGFIIPETRQDLTKNNIALIVPQNSTIPISDFQDLTSKQVKRVALGSENVSAGVYTKEALISLKIYDPVKKKGVFAQEDIREVLRAVETRNVDAGITFLTEIKLSNKVKLVTIAPESSHSPVISPIVVLKSCQNISEAKEFIQFLKSNEAATVFKKYGFTIVK